jgi:hypothetical protein
MIKILKRCFFRLMSRYEYLPPDDCLPRFNGKSLKDLEPEWQVAYLEYVFLLDCAKHYQLKPGEMPD